MHRSFRLTAAAVAVAAAFAVLAPGSLAGPAAAASTSATATVATPPVKPVASLDRARFLGTWRQIADIPQPYEALCVKDVTARYSLNADSTLKVDNRCSGPFGVPIRVVGTARTLDAASPAALQVSFLSLFGTPIFTDDVPNYLIIGIAPDYSWAVIGSSDRSTGYVLSRTATLPAASLAAAKAVLTHNGYNPCSLTLSPQTGGAKKPGPLC